MTPHQQSGGLEALIEKQNKQLKLLAGIVGNAPGKWVALGWAKKEQSTAMTLAYDKGRADRDEEVRGIAEGMKIPPDFAIDASLHSSMVRNIKNGIIDNLLTAFSPDVKDDKK